MHGDTVMLLPCPMDTPAICTGDPQAVVMEHAPAVGIWATDLVAAEAANALLKSSRDMAAMLCDLQTASREALVA